MEPMNLASTKNAPVDGLLSSVVYDKIFKTGSPGRVYVTLRNAQFE
jgi:hypothetical protein